MKRLHLPKFTLIPLVLLCLGLSSCETLDYLMFWKGAEDPQAIQQGLILEKLSDIDRIYIQSLTGPNLDDVKKVLFKELNERGYELVDILPDDIEGMGVMRMKVENFTIWENLEYPEFTDKLPPKGREKHRVIRRNALVEIKMEIFDGKSGMALIRQNFIQPFQQVYIGQREIEKRLKEEKELKRLTQLVSSKIISRFDPEVDHELEEYPLERGESFGWFSEEVHNSGDHRIMKGNLFARHQEYAKAILMWKIVLFTPKEGEPETIYIKNRAAAFFNLGQIYHSLHDYLYAAKMYSQANRLRQELHYAEAWGNNMLSWLDAHKMPVKDKKEVKVKPKVVATKIKKLPSELQNIQNNEKLLLDAKQLWPLEPLITDLEDHDLNGLEQPRKELYPKGQSIFSEDVELTNKTVKEAMIETPLELPPKQEKEKPTALPPQPKQKPYRPLIQPSP